MSSIPSPSATTCRRWPTGRAWLASSSGFYARPQVIEALGGESETQLHQQQLESNEDAREALRWKLDRLAQAGDWSALEQQVERLQRLIVLAGAADDDVVRWTRLAIDRCLALESSNDPVAAAAADATAAALRAATGNVLSDTDPASMELDQRAAHLHRLQALRQFGAREQDLSLRLGPWFADVGGSFSASASPSGGSGSFASASASTSLSGSATGYRAELAWASQAAPLGPRRGLEYGAVLVGQGLKASSTLELADPATDAGTSLNHQGFASDLLISSVGLDLMGGGSYALGDAEHAWTVHGRLLLGLHECTLRYGTNRGLIDGSGSSSTITRHGLGFEAALEAEIAYRWSVHWSGAGTLGYQYLAARFPDSSDQASFLNHAGTQSSGGSYSERISRLTVSGIYLAIGAAYSL